MQERFPWQRPRSVLVKREAQPGEHGARPEQRDVNELLTYGIVNIDKPSGPSSHQVSAYVKEILKLDKTGHSGTLDPKVTGVLPVALGRGTRIVSSLLTAGKEYVCLMTLHADKDEADIRKAMDSFVGEIDQMPPVRSAVKRQIRMRKIYYIDIIDIKERLVLYRVGCQAGTYIRKLCSDIGKKLGTEAHMVELRRTQAGPFKEDTLCTLQDLKDAFHYLSQGDETRIRRIVMPVERGADHLPKIWVLDSTVNTLCNGASLNVPGVSKFEDSIEKGDLVAVLTLKGELICTGKAFLSSKEVAEAMRGVFVRPEQVLMAPGTYPKHQITNLSA